MNISPFQVFFCDCVIFCAQNNVGPDDYVWDYYNPGIWLEKFNRGMSPEDAVNSVFKSN
jgi:hypothetical protein